MYRLRDPQWVLIFVFLGIVGTVPLVQLGIDIRRDDGIRAFDIFNQPPTATNLRAYERSLETANWASQATRPWVQFVQFDWLRDGGAKAVLGRDGWLFYKPGLLDLTGRLPKANVVTATNDPIPAIVHFRDQLAARGIRLVVMPVPNKESVYPDRLTRRAGGRNGVRSPHIHNLFERLRDAHVETIDLFDAFHAARLEVGATSGAPLYLAHDTHWSPAGVAVAAKAAARRLRELGDVRPGQIEYDERSVSVQRVGDIVRMLQVPRIERSLPPEPVLCEQVVQRDTGEPYDDSPDAEALVLGDSFLRIYQQDDPGSAGFIAHLARELRQPLLSLVNDGGGSTLVRQELRGRPAFLKGKRVVLWAFVERDIGLGIDGWKLVALPPELRPSQN